MIPGQPSRGLAAPELVPISIIPRNAAKKNCFGLTQAKNACRLCSGGFDARVATGVFFGAHVLKKKNLAFSQLGFGPEQGIDSIGSYWFYCNASNEFGQKCLVCPTDLSHVTVFRRAKTLINSQAEVFRLKRRFSSGPPPARSRSVGWPLQVNGNHRTTGLCTTTDIKAQNI